MRTHWNNYSTLLVNNWFGKFSVTETEKKKPTNKGVANKTAGNLKKKKNDFIRFVMELYTVEWWTVRERDIKK